MNDNDIALLLVFITDELPSDGEWFSSGDEDFMEQGLKMLHKGFTLEEVKEILQKLYNATAGEFGG